MGGVEMHIWYLAQCLMQRGHKVIVVTHAYGDRQGVRYMTNGLKVYYLPLSVFYDQVTLPTLHAFFPLFRDILVRENISLVHGHQSTSTLTNECILFARTMGYQVRGKMMQTTRTTPSYLILTNTHTHTHIIVIVVFELFRYATRIIVFLVLLMQPAST